MFKLKKIVFAQWVYFSNATPFLRSFDALNFHLKVAKNKVAKYNTVISNIHVIN